jgi:hypothetical protein
MWIASKRKQETCHDETYRSQDDAALGLQEQSRMVLKLHELEAGPLGKRWPIALKPHGEECSRRVA